MTIGRPRLALNTTGAIRTRHVDGTKWKAIANHRDADGRVRQYERSGPSKTAAITALKKALAAKVAEGTEPAEREECNACDPRPLGPYHQPYDHVHWEQVLPRHLTTDDCVRRCGYAVGFAGSIQQTWVFFADLEPALVFGRAGRMSSVDIRSYGVYHAVHEVKFDEQSNRDVHTLYLQHGSLERQPDKQEVFQRWLAGTIPPRRTSSPHAPLEVPQNADGPGRGSHVLVLDRGCRALPVAVTNGRGLVGGGGVRYTECI